MAKKQKQEGKKRKTAIVREIADSRFKEITKDKEKEDKFTESNLEEGLENSNFPPDSGDFIDFTAGRKVSPVLEFGNNVQGNLENLPAPARTTENTDAEDDKKYIITYSSPAYTPGSGEERTAPLVKQMKDSGLIITQEQAQMRMPQRTERIREWHEIHNTEDSDSVLSAQRMEDERGLPFEKRKYKPRT